MNDRFAETRAAEERANQDAEGVRALAPPRPTSPPVWPRSEAACSQSKIDGYMPPFAMWPPSEQPGIDGPEHGARCALHYTWKKREVFPVDKMEIRKRIAIFPINSLVKARAGIVPCSTLGVNKSPSATETR